MSVNKESEYEEIREFLNQLESISGQVSVKYSPQSGPLIKFIKIKKEETF